MVNPSPGGFLKPKHPKTAAPEQPTDPYADLYGYVTPPETTGFGGFVDQLKYINRTSPGAFMQLGAGLMGGDAAGGISRAGQALQQGEVLQQRAREKMLGRQEEQQNRNLTRQWLLSQGFDEATADAAMANPEILQQLLAAPKGTDDITEYNLAQQQGFQGSFVDFKLAQIREGVQAPPAPPKEGYRIVKQKDGTWAYEEVPVIGGDPKKVAQESARDIATETIVSAADKARTAAKGRLTGAWFQDWMAQYPTQAREVQAQVDALRANASAQAIKEQRAAVGATGTVSDADLKAAADKAGALDPKSPNFEQQLNDYERTLLRVIHGPDVGEQIYRSTRKVEGGLPTVNSQADFDALPSGAHFIEDGVVYTKP